MKNNKIHYEKALKKQIWLVAVSMTFIIAFPFATGLKTDLLFYSWFGVSITMFFLVLNILKKQAKEAKCPHCDADLFEVIEMARSVKLNFNYCPSCGKTVEL